MLKKYNRYIRSLSFGRYARGSALLVIFGTILVLYGLYFLVTTSPYYMKVLPCSKIMSTPQFNITAVGNGDVFKNEPIEKAEAVARIVEKEMNAYDPASDIGRINSAVAGQWVKVSPETMAAILAAKKAYQDTYGAFDATVRPLIKLWKSAGKAGKLPTKEQIEAARKSSSWNFFKIDSEANRILKTVSTAQLDLGGIAKGYAIDQAITVLQDTGCYGGLVDIGGDIRCFGRKPSGEDWRIAVRNPFEPRSNEFLGVIRFNFICSYLRDGAVCTSGNYERFSMIEGKRISHIIDPRTGQPVNACPSATVIAPDATTADAWATALSVLGEKGIKLLDERFSHIKAMIIIGDKQDFRIIKTKNFPEIGAKN